ncbi:uncharacterized protein LOC142108891 isoform X3 [Mixophyes fleayi]|uniref:uncharacterized protein LOC142108891 isoform X3 n=1 Tax=Mixophyes fleayi TaxID=3061075 RepID=UPI003F4D8CEF
MLRLSLSVFVMLHLHTCVLCEDPCAQRTVSGIQGGDVTLQLDQTRITFIQWTFLPSAGAVATTKPGGSIDYISNLYRGRVSSTGDGSLHITNLTEDDQRIYAASIQKEREQECLHFILTVYRTESGVIQSERTHIIVAVILLIIAILIVVSFILWKKKRKRKRQEIETPTTYVQVVDSPRHEENQYDSATRPEQSVVTSLYSEVQPVRKNKSQRQENKQNVQPAPETVYSFVANSTESPSQRQNCYKNNGASAQQEVNSVYSTVNHPTVPE